MISDYHKEKKHKQLGCIFYPKMLRVFNISHTEQGKGEEALILTSMVLELFQA